MLWSKVFLIQWLKRLNGKIQEVKSVGRGYRNFRSAILFFHGGIKSLPTTLGVEPIYLI